MIRAALAACALCLFSACPAPWPSLVVETAQVRLQAPRPVLFQRVMVFDSREGRLSGPTDVLVTSGQVREMSPEIVPTGNEELVKGAGRTLLPGLIDSHVHLGGDQGEAVWSPAFPDPAAQAAALLYAGVTTALVGTHTEGAWSLQRAIADGQLAGPRIFRASRMLTSVGGHPEPVRDAFLGAAAALLPKDYRPVANAAEGRARVRAEIAENAPDFIKVAVDSCGGVALQPDILAAIADEAHRRGRQVLVHPGTVEDAMLAMQMGADMLMHAPSCGELTEVQRATLSLRHIPVVTTLRVYDVLGRMFQEPLTLTAFERRLMRPGAEKAFAAKGDLSKYPRAPKDFSAKMAERAKASYANIKSLLEGGAVVIAGSDSGLPGMFHGAALHEELVAMVYGLGLSPGAALRMATYVPGRALMPDGALGAIEVGAWADLVLVEGDPTKSIEATKDIVGVWQRGRPIPRRTFAAGMP